MAIIDSTIKMERFRKFLEKRFKTIQLEDTKGVVDMDFSEIIPQFKVAFGMNPNYLSFEDLSLFPFGFNTPQLAAIGSFI